MSEEVCPKCGKKLVKMPTWGFPACVNPFCENYPIRSFFESLEREMLRRQRAERLEAEEFNREMLKKLREEG